MIKVLSCEEKLTKLGKPFKKLEVETEGEIRWVSMWSNYPNFANIKAGSEFDGKMTKEGNYWNLSMEGAVSRGGGFKTADIAKAQEVKRTDIKNAQDNKENSIKIASTMRMAVDLALAEYGTPEVLDTLEQGIEKWRAYLWKNWDKTDADFEPF